MATITKDLGKVTPDIDATLTQSGQAADAKATGDEIADLKEDLEQAIEDFAVPTQEAVDNWLDEHPEATTAVQDWSLTYKKLAKGTLGFATPEMYGAVGDGVTDDSDAINECLHANKFVFIPKGYYRITQKLEAYCRDNLTVICDNKAIFIADGINDCMIEFSKYVGYSTIGVSWQGGIFDMNGIEGITGIKVNSYCAFGCFKDITILDVGDQSTGMKIEITSGKNNFDNITIFGASFNIHTSDPTGNISLNAYDLTRNNIGLSVVNSYDFSIQNIYIMGCLIGIQTNGSAQVDVGMYHYWLGTNGENGDITSEQFQKSRAFKALRTGDHWHFNMFYPDKPYIGAECNFITCDNTHYICIPLTGVSDDDSPHCYLAKMIDDYGSMNFQNLDVLYTGRAEFRGVDASLRAFRRGGAYIEQAYFQRFAYLSAGLMINNNNEHNLITYTVAGNKWLLIGYVNASIGGCCTIEMESHQNVISLKADIFAKNYAGVVANSFSFAGTQTFNWFIGLGAVATINGSAWFPVYIKSDYSGSMTEFEMYISVSGMMPFCLSSDLTTYVTTVNYSKQIPTENT